MTFINLSMMVFKSAALVASLRVCGRQMERMKFLPEWQMAPISLTNDLHMSGSLAAQVASQLAFPRARLSSYLLLRGTGSDNGTAKLCKMTWNSVTKVQSGMTSDAFMSDGKMKIVPRIISSESEHNIAVVGHSDCIFHGR
jgi:hypothetical protein